MWGSSFVLILTTNSRVQSNHTWLSGYKQLCHLTLNKEGETISISTCVMLFLGSTWCSVILHNIIEIMQSYIKIAYSERQSIFCAHLVLIRTCIPVSDRIIAKLHWCWVSQIKHYIKTSKKPVYSAQMITLFQKRSQSICSSCVR